MSHEIPTVSVIMPVYNGATYLTEAIESMQRQTFEDFEYIIVDDGSTDDSLNILKNYAAEDSRIQIITRPNTGIVGALNDGLTKAQGTYVARMDADDIALPERLAKQVQFLEENHDCVAVGSHVLFIDDQNYPIFTFQTQADHSSIQDKLLKGSGGALIHPTTVLRRDVLEKINGYRPEYQLVEDFDLYTRLSTLGTLANIPEVLLHYRQHAQSTNFTKRKTQQALIQKRLDEFRQEHGLEPLQLPEEDPYQASKQAIHQQWAQWAVAENFHSSARRHALIALKAAPFKLHSWRFLIYILKQKQP